MSPVTAWMLAACAAAGAASSSSHAQEAALTTDGTNPIVRDVFTADPAPLVVGDTLYLYVGHDNAAEGEMFTIPEWLCYSTKDMKTWTAEGPVMRSDDFAWARPDSAWASQVVERDGTFYFYTTVRYADGQEHSGSAVGVATSDSPTGPFVDAIGEALVNDGMTPGARRPWNDIDPTAFEDDQGQWWISWGNGDCYLAKLGDDMTSIDGEIMNITDQLEHFEEGPWLHKRGELYYLTYAYRDQAEMNSEQIAYATAERMAGPWTFRGKITGPGENSFTIHPGIAEFGGQWYLFYHDASLEIDGVKGTLGRRNVRAEYLHYNDDGTIRPIEQTRRGVSAPPERGEGRREDR